MNKKDLEEIKINLAEQINILENSKKAFIKILQKLENEDTGK
jgi:hypothetical protein